MPPAVSSALPSPGVRSEVKRLSTPLPGDSVSPQDNHGGGTGQAC